MPIRLSGLISGLDTDALVQELVSAYSTKKDNYVKAQTKLEWKMDAWKSLNTKVYSFYTNKLSNLRFSNAYSKKSVTVSDTTKATISAGSDAVNGDQTLAVNKLAKTGYLTGAKMAADKDGNAIKLSTKLSSLQGFSEGMINVNVDGKETNIELKGDMTIGQFTARLKDAGLNASFDETNQRMFVSSKTSGAGHDFSLTGNTAGTEALKSLGIFSVSTADIEKYKDMAAYTDDQLESFALNEYLGVKISEANKTYTDKNAELNETNAKLNKELSYANMTSQNKAKTYVTAQNEAAKLESEIEKLKNDTSGTDNTETIEAKQKQLDAYNEALEMYDRVNTTYGIRVTGTAVDEASFETVTEPAEDDIKSYVTGLTDAITANKNEITENSKAVSENTKLLGKTYTKDEIMALEFTAYGESTARTVGAYATETAYTDILSKYQDMRTNAENMVQKIQAATGADGNIDMNALGASDAVRISGEDSEIVLNGATFTSNTNNYSINGLTITATGITEPGNDITVTTSTDVDGIYNMIKDYMKSYNELIKEMDTLFGADAAKGYEPLTDDEKEAMSEKEIEKWEAKIKDSLLRRDSTLDGVISAMKTSMSMSYKVGDTSYSLASFGISTMGYFAAGENEKGVYHIDGDSEDAAVSGNTDKLKKAIANDPDSVVNFFSQLTTGLYDTLTKKMASSSISSAYTIYNDKEMKRRYDEYDDTIDKWEEKVSAIEEKYYKQFSAMETAMSKLQSSTSALSSLMGS